MLQKGFLRDKGKIDISKKRFWTSAIIGLLASFSIYTFFCMFRMVFRTLEFAPVNGPLIFDPDVRYAQNIGFTVLALALGNSLFLGYLFRKPLKLRLPEYKRTAIINNQIFVGFNFFYVFANIFVLGGVFLALYSDLNAFPTYTPIFILIALVLFFESYKSLLRQFRMKAFKALWLNFGILAVLTFLFASTSVFDYKKMDAILLAENPPVDLPITTFKSVPKSYRGSIIKLIYENGEVRYQMDGEFVKLIEIRDRIIDQNLKYHYNYRRSEIHLLAPKSIPMHEIWKVQDELYAMDKYDLIYVTSNPKNKFTKRFERRGIEKRLSISASARQFEDYLLGAPPPPPPPDPFWPNEAFIKKQKIVTITIDDAFMVDEQRLTKKELLPFFKNAIDSTTLFYFQYDETISYEKYISLYSSYKQAIYELRKSEELVKVDAYRLYMGMVNLDARTMEKYEEDQRRLRTRYPTRYVENYEFDYSNNMYKELYLLNWHDDWTD